MDAFVLARRFLYLVACLIVLVLGLAVAWNLFQGPILRMAFVPGTAWSMPRGAAPDYDRPESWIARPASPTSKPVAVFFVMPTAALERDRWNAALVPAGDTAERQKRFVEIEASPFQNIGTLWIPRYRQAVIGAFLDEGGNGPKALDFAYRDIARAFTAFVKALPADQPILLAGHSQGTFHLMRLLREEVAGRPVAKRIAAAYLVGWPISLRQDVPKLGLAPCAKPDSANCLISWQSFAEPADKAQAFALYGGAVTSDPMLCVNPLTGAADTRPAAAIANKGALAVSATLEAGKVTPGTIPARCAEDGLLMIGAPPEGYDGMVFPGNNYHVYDYALFWANVRADAERRVSAFRAR